MKTFLASIGLALVVANSAAAATFTVFTDRALFDAAAGATSSENFNSVVGEPSFNGSDLTVGDLTLRNDNTISRGYIDQPPAEFSVFNIDGTANANIFTDTNRSFTLGFSSAITAFGADFGGMNDGLQRSVFNVLGDDIFAPIQSGNTVQFFGFISDMAFSSLSIFDVNDEGDGFSMDNVSYGTTIAPVPLPAGGLLLLSALGGIAALRRRNKPTA
jgi:hypothetical protein